MSISYRCKEKDRKEICKVCQTEYIVQKCWSEEWHEGFDSIKPCPTCDYNTKYDGDVFKIIEENLKVIITPKGSSCNSTELSDLVIKRLQEIWPKGMGEKK